VLLADAKIGLTIHLLKPDRVSSFESALKKPGQEVRPLAAPLDGEFIPLPSEPGEPAWVDAVRSVLQNSDGLALDAQSPAGLLVVRRGSNTFVLSFGHAWQKLEEKWIEPDFGLRIALNAIPRSKLIEVRAEQVFARRHIASERAPRASFVDEFGVEFDRDLLAVLEGIPVNKKLGAHIRGGSSLRLQLPFTVLADTLDRAERLFRSTAYKQKWPEVGNVSPLRDLATIDAIESQMDLELASGKALRTLVLFTPAERRDEKSQLAQAYVFGRMASKPVYRPYLRIESWISFLAEKQLVPSVAEAKSTNVHLMDEDKVEFNNYSVFDCFCYDLTYGGRPYILSSGTWYEVVPDFLARVNRYIGKIKEPIVSLPPWNQVETETAYNMRCAKGSGFLHFDSANVIFGGGQSRFEFCDFLHQKTNTLFFAKIASKSSGMSHLVEQVRRTAELLFNTDSGYRTELVKVFKKYHPHVDAAWLRSRPSNADWKLCMISLGRAAIKLPFFAKCSLWRVHKTLTERGHEVFFVSV
jgi:uncharacterized protein (TIGR04141 family)